MPALQSKAGISPYAGELYRKDGNLMHEHDHHEHHDHHQITPEALLAHMAEHNLTHMAELEEIAAGLPGQAGELVKAAAADMRSSNEKLEQALKCLKEN